MVSCHHLRATTTQEGAGPVELLMSITFRSRDLTKAPSTSPAGKMISSTEASQVACGESSLMSLSSDRLKIREII